MKFLTKSPHRRSNRVFWGETIQRSVAWAPTAESGGIFGLRKKTTVFAATSSLLLLAVVSGCAPERTSVPIANHAPASSAPVPVMPTPTVPAAVVEKIRSQEETRADCVAGRRLICGRVLAVSPAGLVVDSGYTDLLRPPLTQSWVVPGDVSVQRNPNILELNEPGTPCIGLAFLTDVSKRKKVKPFDYVILMGYPAGHYVYSPAPNVKKTIREFAGGLESAVRLTLKAEASGSVTNAPGKS